MTRHDITVFAMTLGLIILPLSALAASPTGQDVPPRQVPDACTPLRLAQATAAPALEESSCSCLDLECENDTADGCEVSCEAPQRAQCDCDARCDAKGYAFGNNQCSCE
jgi:hypothetical protein